MRKIIFAAILLVGTAGWSGCSFAGRSVHYGAPGRLRQGDLEIGGGVSVPGIGQKDPYHLTTRFTGAGWIGYGITDSAAIETGVDGMYGAYWTGFLGTRLTHAPNRNRKYHAAIDGEFGIGAGAMEGSAEPRAVSYAGLGVGYELSYFSLFARTRLQTSFGKDRTAVGTWVGGMQVRLARTVDVFISGGLLAYKDYGDDVHPFLDAGVAVRFGIGEYRRRRATPAARNARPRR